MQGRVNGRVAGFDWLQTSEQRRRVLMQEARPAADVQSLAPDDEEGREWAERER